MKTGDFIYSRLFAWRGAFGVINTHLDGCYVSGEFPTFTPIAEKIDITYLQLWFRLSKIIEIVEADCTGSTPLTRNRFKENFFLALEIPLPPLEEQRRIVARIEELAARIEEARGLRYEAEEEAEALPHVTARKLLSEIQVQSSELHHCLDTKRDGVQTGPFGAQLGTQDFTHTGIPILTIGNIQYSGLKLDNLKYVSEQKAEQLARFVIREGDILFARMGTVGRCCVASREAEGWLFNYHIIRVALDKAKADSRYIHWSIQASPDIEEYLDEKIRGATRQGVNSTIVSSLPVRIPPLPEQRRIVTYLDDLQAKVDALRQLQAKTQADCYHRSSTKHSRESLCELIVISPNATLERSIEKKCQLL